MLRESHRNARGTGASVTAVTRGNVLEHTRAMNRCTAIRKPAVSQQVAQDRVAMVGAAGNHEKVSDSVRTGKPSVERITDDADGVEQSARREPGETGGASALYSPMQFA